ncbi:MAG: energy-coupling factor transporter transmembrane protein EcfT [Erysipelotrichaceae bacterium]|nr:energy-coupling factor transporter transmembrane protein EcfT [Erysipelotrichaceae bacterium]
MNNITLGQYLPLDSFFHKLDPRTKICAMFAILIAIFIPTGFVGYGVIAVVLVASYLAAKLKFSYVLKAMKPMIFMIGFLLIINCFVIQTGTLLVEFWKIKIYSDALIQTLYIVFRLFLMLMTTTLLTATTKPLDLTLGLEDLMAPLQKINVPTHDISMMISLALRFIPTLMEEAERILKSQASRGVDLENGSFKEKIQAILSLIVPLFVSCFQKADDLADAMEARGYIVGGERVRYKQLKFKGGDYVVLIIVNLLLAALIGYSIWLKKA